MPYFPKEEQRHPYHCQGCRRWFLESNMKCCVAHAPGTCCHKYETEVPGPSREPRPKLTRNDLIEWMP